jgi:hypothetical protein
MPSSQRRLRLGDSLIRPSSLRQRRRHVDGTSIRPQRNPQSMRNRRVRVGTSTIQSSSIRHRSGGKCWCLADPSSSSSPIHSRKPRRRQRVVGHHLWSQEELLVGARLHRGGENRGHGLPCDGRQSMLLSATRITSQPPIVTRSNSIEG